MFLNKNDLTDIIIIDYIKYITYNYNNKSFKYYICNLVKSLDINNNIDIINLYSNDLYNAIELYKSYNNNKLSYNTKNEFYEKLAFISLYKNLNPKINNILSKSNIFI